MKATIDVKDRKEADAIRAALAHDATRAFVIVMGSLVPLSPRARECVLRFVSEHFQEVTDGQRADCP